MEKLLAYATLNFELSVESVSNVGSLAFVKVGWECSEEGILGETEFAPTTVEGSTERLNKVGFTSGKTCTGTVKLMTDGQKRVLPFPISFVLSEKDRELGRAKSDLGDLMNLESTEHVFDMPVVCGTDTITINLVGRWIVLEITAERVEDIEPEDRESLISDLRQRATKSQESVTRLELEKNALMAKISELEIENSERRRDITLLERENTENKFAITRLERENAENLSKRTQLEHESNELRASVTAEHKQNYEKLAKLNRENVELSSKLLALERENSEITEKKNKVEADALHLEETIQELETKNTELKQTSTLTEINLLEVNERYQLLETKLSQTMELVADLKDKNAQQLKENSELSIKLDEHRILNSDCSKIKEDYEKKLTDAKQTYSSLQKQVEAHKKEMSDVQEKLAEDQSKIKEMLGATQELQQANKQIKFTNENLRSEVTHLGETLNRAYKTIGELMERKKSWKEERKYLMEQTQTLQNSTFEQTKKALEDSLKEKEILLTDLTESKHSQEAKLLDEREKLNSDISELMSSLSEKSSALEKATDTNKLWESKNEELNSIIEQQTTKLASAEKEMAALLLELAGCKDMMTVFQTELEEHVKTKAKLEDEKKAALESLNLYKVGNASNEIELRKKGDQINELHAQLERLREETKEQAIISGSPHSGDTEIFKEKIAKLEAELKSELEEKRTLKEVHLHVEQEKNLLLGKVEELESQVQEEREKCALQTEKVNALLDEKMERLAEHQKQLMEFKQESDDKQVKLDQALAEIDTLQEKLDLSEKREEGLQGQIRDLQMSTGEEKNELLRKHEEEKNELDKKRQDQVNKLSDEKKEIVHELAKVNEELTETKEKVQEINARLEKAKEEQEKEAAGLGKAKKELGRASAALEVELQTQKDKKREAKRKVLELTQQFNASEEKLKVERKKVEDTKKEKEELEKTVARMKEEQTAMVEAHEEALAGLRKENEVRVINSDKTIAGLNERMKEIEREEHKLQEQVEKMRAERNEEKKELILKFEEVKGKLEMSEKEVKLLEEENNKMVLEMTEEKNKMLGNHKEEKERWDELLRKYEQEIKELNETRNSLQEERAVRSKEIESLKDKLLSEEHNVAEALNRMELLREEQDKKIKEVVEEGQKEKNEAQKAMIAGFDEVKGQLKGELEKLAEENKKLQEVYKKVLEEKQGKADELQVIVHKLTEEEDRAKYLTAQLAALKEEERGNVEGKEEKILVEKLRCLERELDREKEDKRKIKQQQLQTEQERNSLTEKLKEKDKQLAQAQTEKEAAQVKNDEDKRKLQQELETTIRTLMEQNKSLLRKYDDNLQQHEEFNKVVEEKHVIIEELKAERQKLNGELEDKKRELEEETRKCQESLESLASETETEKKIREELEIAKKEAEEMKREAEERRRKEIEERDRELSTTREELEKLQELNIAKEDEISKFRLFLPNLNISEVNVSPKILEIKSVLLGTVDLMSCTNYDPLNEELDGLDRHSKEFVDHLLENHLEEKDLDDTIFTLVICSLRHAALRVLLRDELVYWLRQVSFMIDEIVDKYPEDNIDPGFSLSISGIYVSARNKTEFVSARAHFVCELHMLLVDIYEALLENTYPYLEAVMIQSTFYPQNIYSEPTNASKISGNTRNTGSGRSTASAGTRRSQSYDDAEYNSNGKGGSAGGNGNNNGTSESERANLLDDRQYEHEEADESGGYHAIHMLRIYERALRHLRRWNVYHSVIIQFFHQIFHYGDVFLFEELVKSPHLYCLTEVGIHAELVISEINDWKYSQLKVHARRVHRGMSLKSIGKWEYITEASKLMIIDKWMLRDKELVVSLFPTLTSKGTTFNLLYRLLSYYQPSPINPHPIPEVTLKSFRDWGADPDADLGTMLIPIRR